VPGEGWSTASPARLVRLCGRRMRHDCSSASSQEPTFSGEFREQRFGLFEVGGVEAFGEPAVDRRQEIMGLGEFALVSPQPGEARRGAQLQGFRLLTPGGIDRSLEP
jgi:hypothetical protein